MGTRIACTSLLFLLAIVGCRDSVTSPPPTRAGAPGVVPALGESPQPLTGYDACATLRVIAKSAREVSATIEAAPGCGTEVTPVLVGVSSWSATGGKGSQYKGVAIALALKNQSATKDFLPPTLIYLATPAAVVTAPSGQAKRDLPLLVDSPDGVAIPPGGAEALPFWSYDGTFDEAQPLPPQRLVPGETSGSRTLALRLFAGVRELTVPVLVRSTYNRPPTVAITSPASGRTFIVGELVTFAGSATDPEDGPLSGAALVWTADGVPFGTGATAQTSTLAVGPHTIALTATDSQGLTGVFAIQLAIALPTLTPLWSFSVGEENVDGIAGGENGITYVLSHLVWGPGPLDSSGMLRGIGANGQVLWSVLFTHENEAGPLVGPDGSVYVAGRGRSAPRQAFVAAFNASNGALRWVRDGPVVLSGSYFQQLLLVGSTLIASTRENVWGLDPATGTDRWPPTAPTTPPGYFASAGVARGGTVFLPDWAGALHAIDAGTGVTVWTASYLGRALGQAAIGPSGTMYFESYDASALVAVDPDGTRRWMRAVPHTAAAKIVLPGGDLLACDGTRPIRLHPDNSVAWSGAAIGCDRVAVATLNDVILLGDLAGSATQEIRAVSGRTGAVLTYLQFPGTEGTPLLSLQDGGVLVVSSRHGVRAYQTSFEGLAPSSWPMAGHDLALTYRLP